MPTKKKRILFVDNPFFMVSCAIKLRGEGYFVRIFYPSGDQKLERLKSMLQEGWDLIILDPAYFDRSENKELDDLLRKSKSKILIWHHYSDHGLYSDLVLEKPIRPSTLLKEVEILLK